MAETASVALMFGLVWSSNWLGKKAHTSKSAIFHHIASWLFRLFGAFVVVMWVGALGLHQWGWFAVVYVLGNLTMALMLYSFFEGGDLGKNVALFLRSSLNSKLETMLLIALAVLLMPIIQVFEAID